ncbi:NYN domain-containing protein [Lentzea sp. NPDC060358]|uniref:NYN domain-containing protein n=1 Tax=Lentzea sp. NPDC060358 TaxID=3347103 RepID=UPI0036502575
MRAYWYDSMQENTAHPDFSSQLERIESLRHNDGIQVRLGSLHERPNQDWQEIKKAFRQIGASPEDFLKHYDIKKKRYEQKGVDTLLVLDMVKLAQLNSYDNLLLIAGDTDLAEAVRTVQEYGKRVIIARPEKCGNAARLFDLADELVLLTEETLRPMLIAQTFDEFWDSSGAQEKFKSFKERADAAE